MKSLDRTDLKILQALQSEGRLTNQTLAQRVALSPSACLSRVRQLEEAGVISGYHAHIAVEMVRPTLLILAEISLKQHNSREFTRFESTIRNMPEIVEAAQVSGQFDYLLKVVVPDIRAWRELAGRLQDGESGVEKVITHIVLKDAKTFCGFPLK
jgi:Lrp/AsnC family transcriptional regulator, leucine-responsive regulatory protein